MAKKPTIAEPLPVEAEAPPEQPDNWLDETSEPPSLQEEREGLEAQVAQIDASIRDLQAERAQIVAALDEVIIQIEGNPHPHENQIAIQAAIARSMEVRAARAARVQQLIDLGASPGELATNARSPLDNAIAQRNRSKAVHRPQFKRVAA